MGTDGRKAWADKLQVRHCNYHFSFWKENHKFGKLVRRRREEEE